MAPAAPPRDRQNTPDRWSRFASALDGVLRADQIIRDPAELITYERDAGLDRAGPDAVPSTSTTSLISR